MIRRLYIYLFLLSCIFCNVAGRAQVSDIGLNLEHYYHTGRDIIYDTFAIKATLIHVSSIYNIKEKQDSVRYLLYQTLYNGIASNYKPAIANSLRLLSDHYSNKLEVEKSNYFLKLGFFYNALEAPSSIQRGGYALLSIIAAKNHYLLEHYDTTVYFLQQALSVNEDLSHWGSSKATLYNYIGACWGNLKQWKQAIYYFKKAELEANTPDEQAVTALNLGCVYLDYYEDNPKALLHLKKATELSKSGNGLMTAITAHNNIAEAYIRMGMPSKAIPHLRTAYTLSKAVDDKMLYAGIKKQMGHVYHAMKDYDKGTTMYLDVLTDMKTLKQKRDVAELTKNLSQIYGEQGKFEKAYEYAMAYNDLNKTQQKREADQALSLQIKYRTAEKDKTIAQKELLIAQQSNRIKDRNIWIICIAAGLLVLAGMMIAFARGYNQKQKLQAEKIRNLEQTLKIERLEATLQGEEKERSRIARELHDGVLGQFLAMKLSINAMQKRHPALADTKDCQDVLSLIDEAAGDLRTTTHKLLPDVLLHNGLVSAVEQICEKINGKSELHIDLQSYGAIPNLQQDFLLSIYRIVQELTQNIVKHAKATDGLIQLIYQNNLLSITIEDNGIGFDHSRLQAQKGIGLANIHTRMAAMNGRIEIKSDSKTGTVVYMEFDVDNHLT